MTCGEARTALLDADPADLRGETDTALAAHLGACTACRAAADAVLATEAAAAGWIAARMPQRGPAEAIARGHAAARRRRHRRWRWAASVAAAAGLVALLVARPAARRPPVNAHVAQAEPDPARVAVAAPAGRSVAVFETANPDLVIIWFF